MSKVNFEKDLDNVVKKFKEKNIKTTKWIVELTDEISRRNQLERNIIFSNNGTNDSYLNQSVNQFTTIKSDRAFLSDGNSIYANNNQGYDLMKANSTIMSQINSWISKIEQVNLIKNHVKIFLNDIKQRSAMKNYHIIDFSMIDYGKIQDAYVQFKTIFDKSINQSIEMENLTLKIASLHDMKNHLSKTSNFTNRLTHVNKINEHIRSTYQKITELNDLNSRHAMRILSKTKKLISPLTTRGISYKNIVEIVKLLTQEIKFLVSAIVDRIQILFRTREKQGEEIKIMILDKRMKGIKTTKEIRTRLFNSQKMDFMRLQSYLSNDNNESGAGYDYKDNKLITALVKQKSYPNSMKNLFEIMRVKRDENTRSMESFEITNKTIEQSFDTINQSLTQIMNAVEKTEDQTKIILPDIQKYIEILSYQDDNDERPEYLPTNEDFVNKFDLLCSILDKFNRFDKAYPNVKLVIVKAQVFEIKLEVLRIKNKGRVTEDEFRYLDKAVKIVVNEAPVNDPSDINKISLLPSMLSHVQQTIRMVESDITGKQVSTSKYFKDIEDERAAIEIEREDEVYSLGLLHKIAANVESMQHSIYNNHRVISASHKINEIMFDFFNNNLKSDIIVLESLVRFIIENDIGVETIVNNEINNEIIELYEEDPTYNECEAYYLHLITNSISSKLSIVDQMNLGSSSLWTQFHTIKLSVMDVLKQKEQNKSDVKNLVLTEFHHSQFKELDQIIKREYDFCDKQLNLTIGQIEPLMVNHLNLNNTLALFLYSFIFIRLLIWKSFIMEIDSRNNNIDI